MEAAFFPFSVPLFSSLTASLTLKENNGDYGRLREIKEEFCKKTNKNNEIPWFFEFYEEIQSFFTNSIRITVNKYTKIKSYKI